jgi:lipopolysaccharide/colanic/teichoic acid biosynthesis glycosyltransferase
MSASESITSRLYAEPLAVMDRALPPDCRPIFRRGIVALEAAADFLTATGSLLAVFWLNTVWRGQPLAPLQERAILSCAASLLIVLLLERSGAYRGGGSLLHIRETERALRIPLQTLVLLLPFLLFVNPHLLREPVTLLREPLVFGLAVLPIPLLLQKQIVLILLRVFHQESPGKRVVVFGAGETARRVVSALLHSSRLACQPVGIIEDKPASGLRSVSALGYRPVAFVPVWSGQLKPAALKTSLKTCRCDLLIVVTQNLAPDRLAAAEQAARLAGARIAFLSGLECEKRLWNESIDLDGLSLTVPATFSSPRLSLLIKRGFDVLVSALLLIALAPLLVPIGLLVMLDSPGPALFVQRRVGRNGELFKIFKFRSMDVDAPGYQRSPTSSHDPRITRVGKVLRRTSLDELPQLINVFLGSMSLVGPRPEMPFIVEGYTATQRQRLEATPGVTGLWQLSADRAFPIHESLEYDLYYMRNRGFFMDAAILIHTLLFAVRGGV